MTGAGPPEECTSFCRSLESTAEESSVRFTFTPLSIGVSFCAPPLRREKYPRGKEGGRSEDRGEQEKQAQKSPPPPSWGGKSVGPGKSRQTATDRLASSSSSSAEFVRSRAGKKGNEDDRLDPPPPPPLPSAGGRGRAVFFACSFHFRRPPSLPLLPPRAFLLLLLLLSQFSNQSREGGGGIVDSTAAGRDPLPLPLLGPPARDLSNLLPGKEEKKGFLSFTSVDICGFPSEVASQVCPLISFDPGMSLFFL